MDHHEQKVDMDFMKNMSVESKTPIRMMINEEYENSSKRSKTVSKVWDYFEKLPAHSGNSKAICKLCRRVYTAKTTSGTSHLRRHVEACLKKGNHGADLVTIASSFKRASSDADQPTISHDTVTDAIMSSKNIDLDIDEVRRAIAMMIVVDRQPFGMVEDTGFRNLMAVAYPEFQAVSEENIKKDVMNLYSKEKENIRELLATCPGRICLTCSTWQSCSGDRYNCVSAHFIDHEWRLQKRVLRFKLIPPPYDGLSVGDEIALCMVQWNIEHKVFSITLDTLASDHCVVAMLKSRLDTKRYLLCKGAFFYVGCFAHLLNVNVQAGFGCITDVIGKLRLCIKYVKQSPHRKKNFYIVAKNLNLDTQKKLRVDSPDRWNSTYDMLEVALSYKDVFTYIGAQDINFKHKLSAGEWEKVSLLCKFLKVFFEVTRILSASRYPTSNLYFKWVWRVYSRVLDMVRGPENILTGMVKEMQSKFSRYWSDYSLILSCAAILDPRYKVKFVEYCYTKLHGNDAQQYVSNVINNLYCLFDEYMQNSSLSSVAGLSVVATNVVNDKEDIDGFEDYETFQSARFRSQVEKSQLDLYLEEPSHDLNSEIDILEYWSLCSLRYPELSRMARDVLTIPVSTVTSENAFVLGSQMISPYCSSLKSKTMQALICLHDWMRAYDRSRCSGHLDNKNEDDSSSSSDDDDDDY